MLNQKDSSSDLSTGNIDENPNIQVKPSIQASSLNKPKQPERKNSQNFLQKSQMSTLKLNPRKNSSASKLIKTKNLFPIKNDSTKRIIEEKTRKIYNFREKHENSSLRKAVDEEKFMPSQKQANDKRGIQSFLKQLQKNCKNIKNRVLSGPKIMKKESFDNADSQTYINKRTSRSPVASKESPKKFSPVKTPNFAFQPLKISSNSRERLIKQPASSRSPDSNARKNFSSPRSEQVLIKKFESEFLKIVNDLDFDSSGMLNYCKFCQVLQKMNFISSNTEKTDGERELLLKAWRLLGGIENSKIGKMNLCNFLLAVSNIVKKTRSSSNDTALSGMKNGTLFINLEDVKRIHRDFNRLHLNRKSLKVKPEPTTLSPQKVMTRPNLINVKELESKPALASEEKRMKSDANDILLDGSSVIFQTSPNRNDFLKQDSDGQFPSVRTVFKPALSIPKVAQQKSTSLRSISCSPENFLQRVKFTLHSNSPISYKKSGNNSVYTSESDGTENSSINPLVTPPSYATKVIHFNDIGYNELIQLTDKSSKRYKCQSPDSYEESEESILVTVVLPDEQEQFIRIHREDDLNSVIKDFGRKHNLEIDQLITLKQEIMQKLK